MRQLCAPLILLCTACATAGPSPRETAAAPAQTSDAVCCTPGCCGGDPDCCPAACCATADQR